jgi:uncharacterized protein YjiS (DUF1127 family)
LRLWQHRAGRPFSSAYQLHCHVEGDASYGHLRSISFRHRANVAAMGKARVAYLHLFERLRLTVGLWWRRVRTRAALRKLDARLLADIGLTPAERRSECAKWFWQI